MPVSLTGADNDKIQFFQGLDRQLEGCVKSFDAGDTGSRLQLLL